MSVYAGLLLSLSLFPVAPSHDEQSEFTITYRDFLLPIAVKEGGKDGIESVIFHVSTDRGRTWQKAGTIAPDEEGFPFHAKEDGDYWFTLQMVRKDKVTEPAKVGEDGAQVMKVRVDTRRQSTSAKASNPGEPYKMPYAD